MSAHETLGVAFLTREVLPTSGGGRTRYEFVSHMTSPDFAGARGANRRTVKSFHINSISAAAHGHACCRARPHSEWASLVSSAQPRQHPVVAVGRSILALVGALCLIAPAALKAITYTHFVSPNGSATSLCTLQQPCSLTRAVTLAGSASMPPGSTVLVQYGADGIYSQPALTFDGSGAAGQPDQVHRRERRAHHRDARQARLRRRGRWSRAGDTPINSTGTRWRSSPPCRPSVPRSPTGDRSGSRTGGRRSRRRRLDASISGFRRCTPPVRSINEVEAQAGTAWHDTANNTVYVHLFDDTAPPRDGTNLYLTSAGWGTLTINGDYIWLENLTIEHATPEGLRVNTSANGTVLKRITALAAIVNLRGINTLAEDLNVSHVIRQRTDPVECYDANPGFGVGECWNANAIGQALGIGDRGRARPLTGRSSAAPSSIVRGMAAGFTERTRWSTRRFWGFPNHTLGGGGTGGVIRNNVFAERAGLDLL